MYKQVSAENQLFLSRFDNAIEGLSLSEIESLTPQELKNILSQSGLSKALIPSCYGGDGLSMSRSLDILQYVASKSPSAGVMLCMHYHVVGTIAMYPEAFTFSKDFLEDICQHNKLVASAFAESIPGQDIFSTSVKATITADSISISGDKKPCTLSSTADYYAVSVITNEGTSGIAVVNSNLEGISCKPFWSSDILSATDSHNVVFTDVKIDKEWLVLAESEEFQAYLNMGLCVFNLMINAAYMGACTSLVNKLPPQVLECDVTTRTDIYGKLAQSYYSIHGVSNLLELKDLEWLVPDILSLRYQNQLLFKDIKSIVFEKIGGYRYLSDKEVHYLSQAVDLIAFHPVSRFSFESSLKQTDNNASHEKVA